MGVLRRERVEIQAWADRIIELEGRDLHWLVTWAGSRPGLAEITLDDFWSGTGRVAHAARR
jgi:type VI secretion system protein ImpL